MRVMHKNKNSQNNLLALELDAMFKTAVCFACGAVEFESSSIIELNKHWTISGDFHTNIANNIFTKHLLGMREAGELPSNINIKKIKKYVTQIPPLRCQIFSEYGIESEAVYLTSREVAEGILSKLPEELQNRLCSSVRVGKDGCISITTKKHLDWHLIMGRLPCDICGNFLKGTRGLRMHQVLFYIQTPTVLLLIITLYIHVTELNSTIIDSRT